MSQTPPAGKANERQRAERDLVDATLHGSSLYKEHNGEKEDAIKEIKVRLPATYIMKLHGLKIIDGTPVSESVKRALAAYFARSKIHHDERAAMLTPAVVRFLVAWLVLLFAGSILLVRFLDGGGL